MRSMIKFIASILSIHSLAFSLKISKPFSFSKYHGLGNDFILVDNTKDHLPLLTPQDGIKLCDRNFGIGADGVIFALPGINGCDYTMRIYNSDGSEPQMCGNGIRCLAKYIYDEIEINKSHSDVEERSYNIWTNAGKIIPKLTSTGAITVDMGEPIFHPDKIPTLLAATTSSNQVVKSPLDVDGTIFEATSVSMGNPHVVRYTS